MSSIYVSEPPTKGKVVMKTTYGPLDIELWPKEAPKAVRNFVQLCLEGYYDDTIFHRIIKSFLVQGGDPTGSGTGGESIYGNVFPDEFHSRLRFNHRGLVACANAGSPHTNGSQFFISLDRCDWLDRKNTIFGKVTGDSIFNLLQLGDVETDKNDRPYDPPPKIISVEVLWNPFEDIIPRRIAAKALQSSAVDTSGKDEKLKTTKKLNLLSFGDEAEEEEKELAASKQKIKSSHDVLNDPRLLKEVPNNESSLLESKPNKELQMSVREALSKRDDSERVPRRNLFDDEDDDDGSDDDGEANFDARMRQQILQRRRELGDISSSSIEKHHSKEHRLSPPRSKIEDKSTKVEKLSLKKKGIGSDARAEHMAKADADLQLLGQAEKERQLQKQKKRRLHGRAEDTLAKLGKFKQAMSSKSKAPVNDTDGENEESEAGWLSHRLKFMRDPSNKDDMARTDDPNEYVVQDPLLEKGKEKFNRMQAKLKRREREWAGKSLT